MEQIEFYEYFINLKKCKITKNKCIGTKVQQNLYYTRFYDIDTGKCKGNSRLINLDELERLQSFRIFSFNDDYEYYKEMLLHEYKLMIEIGKEKLEKQEKFLERLKVSKIN